MSQFKFTSKANEVISEARNIVYENNNIEIQPVHVALALFQDEQGLAYRLCRKMDTSRADIVTLLGQILAKCPRQDPSPDDPVPSGTLMRVLNKAKNIQKRQKDTFISVDTLLQALYENSAVANVLQQQGLGRKQVEEAINVQIGRAHV